MKHVKNGLNRFLEEKNLYFINLFNNITLIILFILIIIQLLSRNEIRTIDVPYWNEISVKTIWE